MAKNNSLPDFLTDLANTIREVEGTSELINPQDFSNRVRAIGASGGGDSQAIVDALIDGSITEVSSNVTKIKYYAFYEDKSLTSVNLPQAKFINGSAFYKCSALTSAVMPNVTSVGMNNFYNCSSLPNIDMPSLSTLGSNTFGSCSKLQNINFPLLKKVDNNTFQDNYALTYAILPNISSVGSYSFNNCYSLIKLVVGINKTSTVTLYTPALNKCYHILGTVEATYNPTGAKDGYIYVPLSLVANYRSATNWSKFATQIMPYVATVEELASVDGTTYDKACVGADYVEYTYNGTSWEVYR